MDSLWKREAVVTYRHQRLAGVLILDLLAKTRAVRHADGTEVEVSFGQSVADMNMATIRGVERSQLLRGTLYGEMMLDYIDSLPARASWRA